MRYLAGILLLLMSVPAFAQIEAFPSPPESVYQLGVQMAQAGNVWWLRASSYRVGHLCEASRVGCVDIKGDYCVIYFTTEPPVVPNPFEIRKSLLAQCTGWQP